MKTDASTIAGLLGVMLLAATVPGIGAEKISCSGRQARLSLDVVTLNLWHDKADWPKRQSVIVHELARSDPDVIVLQEVLQDVDLPNQADTLARALGHEFFFVSADPEGSIRRYGNAILTRHPIIARHWARLKPYGDYRTVAHVRVRYGQRNVDVFGTHLHHTQAGGQVRAIQLRELLAFIERHGSPHTIIAGDFNAPSEADELAVFAPRFNEALLAARQGGDDRPVTTLNPAMGHAPGIIDHIYADRKAFTPIDANIVLNVPDAAGHWPSDHFGVWARFMLSGSEGAHR